MTSSLASATWKEVAAGWARAVVLPIGSCEQHGPHLPLDTDTIVASALAAALGAERPTRVWVAPALPITASGEHAGFPGTLSIGTTVLAEVLVEMGRSADWSGGIVFVNGHGGNLEAMRRVVSILRTEGRRVLAWWPPRPDDPRADAHAGWTETSLLLHLAPSLVRRSLAEPGETAPLESIVGKLRTNGVRAVSANGVLGSPVGASAGDGAALFATWVADLVARFDEWAS